MAHYSDDFYEYFYEEAYEYACQRAEESGDVDIDYDYEIMEAWIDEYIEYLWYNINGGVV